MTSNPDQHLQQWKHNRDLLPFIPQSHPDWIVTVTFYAALQIVDALLASDGVTTVVSHETRNEVLIRSNRYSAIWRGYQPLYNLSRTVRYLAKPEQWIPFNQIEKNVFGRLLYPIENSANKLMNRNISHLPISLQKESIARSS